MNTAEALAAIKANDGKPVIVVSKSGTRYWLEREVVECALDEFVYGFNVDYNHRRRGDYKWFYLKNVTLETKT